ncbi:MAG: AIPR family protein [Eubacteriaceae bacterium]|nr:AIPR family protein [Eubacteriaceae bacterium]
MQIEPIINARFKQFRQKNELENIPDGEAFEKFVNYTILSLHQPDAFGADSELLDFVCVGGMADMGIDGLAIKVNGIIIKSKVDIQDIIKRFKRVEVEFIFIQSKYKPNFNKGELNNFVDGVRDFLSEEHHFPMNDALKQQLILKEYILSDDVIIMWDSNPKVSLYYVAMGRWNEAPDLVGIQNQFQKDLKSLNVYECNFFRFVDSAALKEIYDSIQNTFTATIDTRHIMPLTDVEDVTNSCISIVYGAEFIRLISTEDGIIRKSLFNDNVRDFQGTNPVNSEIYATIQDNPEQFIVLNNGITIVCDEFKQNNTKLSISNPQIVNGCQTSHVIYEAYKRGADISRVPVSIKFISTTKEEIVNDIVRGTNRQNIVLEEAFEATKKFHKVLEEFFIAYSPEYQKIYYERRSKQYQHNPTIKQTEKVNLRVLTQYFVGMFLNKPHDSHRHESILLKDYGDEIFQDSHSKLPYFVAAFSFLKLEKFLREQQLPSYVRPYKAHILMMLREGIAGYVPSFYRENTIDTYSQKILDSLKDDCHALIKFKEIVSVFDSSMNAWETELGKSKSGTKDVEAFTEYLLSLTRKQFKAFQAPDTDDIEKLYSGKVVNIIRDKYGNYCGFIGRQPDNLFFHSSYNKNLNFDLLKGKWVTYKIQKNIKTNKNFAVEVTEVK